MSVVLIAICIALACLIGSVDAVSAPTRKPTNNPTSATPTIIPTAIPTATPTVIPTAIPTAVPTAIPTATPTVVPTAAPTNDGDTNAPTRTPTTMTPTVTPTTKTPTVTPTKPSPTPTIMPSAPTRIPTSASPTFQYNPTSQPTGDTESWGQVVWDQKRHRQGGMCENHCSGHGTCEKNYNCKCFEGLNGEAEWTGPDCSQRVCPYDTAWVGDVVNANDLHPWAECSNKGLCDRKSGLCSCFTGYEGIACQRTTCPNNCNERGTCWPEKHLADKAGRTYNEPWDSLKHVGCLCDAGYRGPACDFQECPSGSDPLDGYGNESGRDCSGRGICNYGDGTCSCFSGFYGTSCQYQTTLF